MTIEEKKFVDFWSAKRGNKQTFKDYIRGGAIGFLMGIGILICVATGWYQRASMSANTSLSPYIFIICLMAISIFIGYFHYQFSWDANEQKYQELMHKEKKEATSQSN